MLLAARQGHASALEGVLSLSADLELPAPPAVNHVPRSARSAIRTAWAAVCRETDRAQAAWEADRLGHDLEARSCLAWTVGMLFGHWLLCSSPRPPAHRGSAGGPSLADHLRDGVDLLRAGDFTALRARTALRVSERATERAARTEANSTRPPDAPDQSVSRVALAASHLIMGGGHHGVQRGVARCTSAPLAPAVARDADMLRDLHPSAPPAMDSRITAFATRMQAATASVFVGHTLPLPGGATPAARVIADGLRLVSALAAARGKAAGPDAVTADILHELLVDCRDCQTATMLIIRRIQDGNCPASVIARLAAARLIGLPKPGSAKLRPIAIAPILRRVAASLLVRHYRTDVETAVGPLQFGFATAGREAVHLVLHATLQAHPDWTLVELDIRNAFNEALRDAMLVECFERLPRLFPMARAFYMQPSDLLFRCSDDGLVTLLSACGSQQGDPFGGVLFDLVLRPILDELAMRFPSLIHTAFQDNMYLVGPVGLIAEAASWLRARLTTVCLVLKPAGYHAWSPSPLSPAQHDLLTALGIPDTNIAGPEAGYVVLGAPLGHPTYVSAMACSIVDSALAVFESPTFCSLITQAQWLGLFYSVSRRVGHLARFIPPALLVQAEAHAHDKLASYMCRFLRIAAPLSQPMRLLLELPLRLGGMGLRLFAREPAFLSGMLAARDVLRGRFTLPTFGVTAAAIVLRLAVSNAFLVGRPLGAGLQAALTSLASMERTVAEATAGRYALPERIRGQREWETLLDPAQPPPPLAELIPDLPTAESAPGLQGQLSFILHESTLLSWRRMVPVQEDAIRVGQSGSCAAAWLLAFPGGPCAPEFRSILRWPGSTFLTALQTRLGAPLSVLVAAGVEATGTPCWLRRQALTVDPAADVMTLADIDITATVAAAPLEEGAREGSSTPSPHVPGDAATLELEPDDDAEEGPPGTPHRPLVPPLRDTAPLSRPHDALRCGRRARGTIRHDGRELDLCANGGFHIYTHDGIAAALTSSAPPQRPDNWPGRRFATAVKKTIGQMMVSLAPSREPWRIPDVASPGDDTFVDVTIVRSGSAHRPPTGGDGRSIVLSALSLAAANKIKHYKDELGPTGPFAPGKGRFVPFAMSSGGLLAPDALGLLKHWAHCRVGEPATASTSSSSAASRPYLLNSLRLTSTVLQRWNACRIHHAAAELNEMHAEGPGPEGEVDAANAIRMLGPCALGLLRADPSEYGLADIDAAGLEPLVSLLR